MFNYRLYCLNRQCKITGAEWVEAIDDAAAGTAARARAMLSDCELWLHNQLIERIPAASRTATAD